MRWMPFIFGLIILMTLRSVVFGEMSNVVDLFVVYSYFGTFSIASFWYRLYTYGHNLIRTRPMHIKPFTPLLIGVKQIANFREHSFPNSALTCSVSRSCSSCWPDGFRERKSGMKRLRRSFFFCHPEQSEVPNCATFEATWLALSVTAISVQSLHAAFARQQERIDAAAPNETIRVEAGIHRGPDQDHKTARPYWRTAVQKFAATVRATWSRSPADNVTISGLRITGSGLQLSDDDAAIFVTGNHATIENCVIADSLHGIYLKKISGAQILKQSHSGQNDADGINRSGRERNRHEHGELRHQPSSPTAAATAFTSGIAKAI